MPHSMGKKKKKKNPTTKVKLTSKAQRQRKQKIKEEEKRILKREQISAAEKARRHTPKPPPLSLRPKPEKADETCSDEGSGLYSSNGSLNDEEDNYDAYYDYMNTPEFELLCQGIKPWDDCAADALSVLYDY
eukprot:gnl/Dysnectes_brevis/1688_a1919_2478.p1 GENE.gnl/Dysnectes_brevis/1688_a1919_2478~~gnl/Dysnectes_brevis/1688_a1919_2478.p1  ORF type:complete len:132 (-),score=12.00 gnl/Dysnectes_brevis/1688_a1919_2478:138-533(-)